MSEQRRLVRASERCFDAFVTGETAGYAPHYVGIEFGYDRGYADRKSGYWKFVAAFASGPNEMLFGQHAVLAICLAAAAWDDL